MEYSIYAMLMPNLLYAGSHFFNRKSVGNSPTDHFSGFPYF